MLIEARFEDKPPEHTADVQRLKICHGDMEIEIVASGAGLYLRLDGLGRSLVVYPHASNGIKLHAGREPRDA